PVAGAGTGAGYPQVPAAVRYEGPIERGNRDLVPSLYLQRAYAARGGAAFAENGWDAADWSEVAWDAVAWTENGWDSTSWEENGWDSTPSDEDGWDAAAWAARAAAVRGD
ncbi:MAG TPA: hypothetical protein VGL23_17365, partial [Chloroflexota bacterium]